MSCRLFEVYLTSFLSLLKFIFFLECENENCKWDFELMCHGLISLAAADFHRRPVNNPNIGPAQFNWSDHSTIKASCSVILRLLPALCRHQTCIFFTPTIILDLRLHASAFWIQIWSVKDSLSGCATVPQNLLSAHFWWNFSADFWNVRL